MANRRKRKPEHFEVGVGRALRLAAKEAQRLAQMYNVPLYYWENGKVVARKPWLSKSSRAKTSGRKGKG
jgi:predicted ATP-grasp superfamily ATP-dependent carboligase